MIRSLAPVLLIPAAWTLTLLTVTGPELDIYWVEHMHYFMLVFLTLFAALSWREMNKEVLKAWRTVITIGVAATAAGAAGFTFDDYSQILHSVSIYYWLLAPGLAAYYTSDSMENPRAYRFTGYAGGAAALLFLQGHVLRSDIFMSLGIVTAGLSQTYAMAEAFKEDKL